MNTVENIRKMHFKATQKEFAEICKVAQSTVHRWENGSPLKSEEMRRIRAEARSRGIAWDDALFFDAPVETENTQHSEGS